MNRSVMKCKLFHQSNWGPYIYSELYTHEITQCNKCGIIYDRVDQRGNSPYELLLGLRGLMVTVIIVGLAVLFLALS